MASKPSYEELEQRVKYLESEVIRYKEQRRKSNQGVLEDFKGLAERSQDAIYHYDLISPKFLFVNKIALELYGFKEEDGRVPTAKSVLLHIHPEDREKVKKAQIDALVPGHKGGESEYRFMHADGTIHWMHDRFNVIRDKSGRPIAIEGIVRDDTERKHAEEALGESEVKYRSMMAAMYDATYICSPDFRVEYMNPAMIKRTGRDATGESCYKMINGLEEKCPWCVHDKIQQGEYIITEIISPKDGLTYNVAHSPIHHVDGSISKLAIYRDITEMKNMAQKLQRAQKMESIGTLTGGIAHDFNNILSIIIGNTELALDDVPEWNPVHFNLEEIKTAGLRAKDIVRRLLSFTRKTDEKLKPIEIVPVIKDALKFLRSTIPTTIDIHQDIQATDETILADPTQINQVMMNLCVNASQAMEQTGGSLTIRVENTVLDQGSVRKYSDLSMGDYVKVTVSDTGPGIDPKHMDRIFDPYFTTREVGKGPGMGLAVVQGIVKNHNGAISVDSKPGKGTTFRMLFPLAEGKAAVETETTQEMPTGNETILFVDDEISIVNIVRKMLERLGYKVETAMTPQDALERFRPNPDHFDLVITDMTMPQMTGVMLAEGLMQIRPDIPVIICTGYSSLIDEEKAKDLGIAAYVMKPIIMTEIAKIIRAVLDKKS